MFAMSTFHKAPCRICKQCLQVSKKETITSLENMGQKKNGRDGLKTMINKCQLAHEDMCSSCLFSFHLSYRPEVCPQLLRFTVHPLHPIACSAHFIPWKVTVWGGILVREVFFPGMFPQCYIFYHYLGNYSDPQNSTFLLFNPLSLGYFATATLGD